MYHVTATLHIDAVSPHRRGILFYPPRRLAYPKTEIPITPPLRDCINALPDEILHTITWFFDVPTIGLTFPLVCKRWHSITHDPWMWQKLCKRSRLPKTHTKLQFLKLTTPFFIRYHKSKNLKIHHVDQHPIHSTQTGSIKSRYFDTIAVLRYRLGAKLMTAPYQLKFYLLKESPAPRIGPWRSCPDDFIELSPDRPTKDLAGRLVFVRCAPALLL